MRLMEGLDGKKIGSIIYIGSVFCGLVCFFNLGRFHENDIIPIQLFHNDPAGDPDPVIVRNVDICRAGQKNPYRPPG